MCIFHLEFRTHTIEEATKLSQLKFMEHEFRCMTNLLNSYNSKKRN